MKDEELDMLIANVEYEPQQLKDYITNLQEELEEQKRIEQASLDTINNLQEENEELKLELSGYRSAILKNDNLLGLQQRIDKAIEFIKESNTYYEITHYIPEDEKQFKINMETLTNHLLNILGGEE